MEWCSVFLDLLIKNMSKEQVDRVHIVSDKEIKGFFRDYRFLSNFHETPICYGGLTYPSTENAYQAAKTSDKLPFTKMSPRDAKLLGKTIEIRSDWDTVRTRIMVELTFIKFMRDNKLKELLIQTGDKYLEETNWWNDTYWGVCNGKGENKLGQILMCVRELIKTTT